MPAHDAGLLSPDEAGVLVSDGGMPDADSARDASGEAQLLRDGARVTENVPPRALFVPELVLAGESGSPLAVEALIRVNRDGSAELLSCEAHAAACAALAAALPRARFEPARVNGAAVDARVRVRFAARSPDAAAGALSSSSDAGLAQTPDAALADGAVRPTAADHTEYGAVARLSSLPPTAIALELEEVRAVPGTFGDPFRVLDALPGVVPVLSGIPYVYVRGAPPASTVYYYDDIQLPALFHLGLGPAVLHPAMIGAVDFYPGVAPARYGRKTGGVMAGQAANRPLRDGVHGELELRLIDVQAYLAKSFENGARLELSGRYGYPGLLLKFIEPTSVVQYWDYQLRGALPLSKRSELSLTALGSYDMIGERRKGRFTRNIELQFHRLELRSVTRFSRATFGAAIGGGIERSGLSDDFNLQAVRVGPRLWLTTNVGKAKLRVGADMWLSFGHIEDPRQQANKGAPPPVPPETGGQPPDAIATIDTTIDPEKNLSNPLYLTAKRRYVTGAYAELLWPFAERWMLEAGLRADVWVTGGNAQPALEPRILLRYQAHPRVGLHVAAGLGYQPAVFMIPVPGLSDVALDRGLQRVIQSEVGTSVALPASLSAETKVFAHFYDRMLSLEALDEEASNCAYTDDAKQICQPNPDAFARMSAYSYGLEFLLRRAFKEPVSGWLAYTLAWADGRTASGRDLRPNFDVRHVANLVLLWRISDKWRVSLRGYVQSGRFPLGASTALDPRERHRLPAFGRGDLQVARVWHKSWGDLQLTFDWLNFTFRKEPIGWDHCPEPGRAGSCKVEYLNFPITVPMLGVRGTY
jgi:TonB dependent receptor